MLMQIKKIFLGCLLLLPFLQASSQQLVHANNVQLVSSPGTRIVSQGGMKFTGTTTWRDSGYTTLLLNPIANQADWVDSTATGVLISDTGTVVFNNITTVQQLIGPTRFYNMRVAGNGVNLHQTNEVKNILQLDTGLVFFQVATDSIYVSNPAFAAITSSSAYLKSWVHGKLRRNINVSGTGNSNEYLFPIGKMLGPDSLYAPIRVQKNNNVLNSYTAVYFPTLPFDNTNILNPPIDHISEVENWEITATNPTGPDAEAKISLSWRGHSRVSSQQIIRDSLLVVQYVNNPSGRWEQTGTPGLHTVSNPSDSLGGWVRHRDYMSGYTFAQRRFTLGTWSRYNALPVKLIYWTAAPDGNRVRLMWKVEAEQDVQKYDIEKSTDGVNFVHMLSVNALQRPVSEYTDYDNNPVTGWNFYRLRITDVSQRITYAGIRKVKFDKGLQKVMLFPNPVTTTLNISLPSAYVGNVSMQLIGVDTRIISAMRPSATLVQLNVSALAKGYYLIRIVNNNTGNTETLPFIKQ